jgi:peptide deformylase
MAAKRILLLGDLRLWRKCAPVKDIGAPASRKAIRDLHDTLADFRRRNGFGRGIAAPQIGVLKRIIYVCSPKAGIDGAFINPRIVSKSKAKMRVWDDCFSFPDLLVRVERAREVAVAFTDEEGKKHTIIADDGLSELLQHEIDHLDGILAVQRAIDRRSFALRREWGKSKKR